MCACVRRANGGGGGGGAKRTVRKSPRGETNPKYQQTQKRTNHETRHKKKDQSTKSTHKIKENSQVRPSGSEVVMSIDNEALTAHRLSQCLETNFPLAISQTARQTGKTERTTDRDNHSKEKAISHTRWYSQLRMRSTCSHPRTCKNKRNGSAKCQRFNQELLHSSSLTDSTKPLKDTKQEVARGFCKCSTKQHLLYVNVFCNSVVSIFLLCFL